MGNGKELSKCPESCKIVVCLGFISLIVQRRSHSNNLVGFWSAHGVSRRNPSFHIRCPSNLDLPLECFRVSCIDVSGMWYGRFSFVAYNWFEKQFTSFLHTLCFVLFQLSMHALIAIDESLDNICKLYTTLPCHFSREDHNQFNRVLEGQQLGWIPTSWRQSSLNEFILSIKLSNQQGQWENRRGKITWEKSSFDRSLITLAASCWFFPVTTITRSTA